MAEDISYEIIGAGETDILKHLNFHVKLPECDLLELYDRILWNTERKRLITNMTICEDDALLSRYKIFLKTCGIEKSQLKAVTGNEYECDHKKLPNIFDGLFSDFIKQFDYDTNDIHCICNMGYLDEYSDPKYEDVDVMGELINAFLKGENMLEIKGKVNTAICYAKVIEDDAIEQIRTMCDYGLTEGSKIRIMPDVHAGAGCTIGTTMTVSDKACPNVVGVDIGCGMYTVQLKEKELDFKKIDEVCHYIPSGRDVWKENNSDFDLERLRCYKSLKNPDRLEKSMGTLGGGNHFIEIDQASNGAYYLIIHSGSRNLGKQVAEYYQQLAIELYMGKKEYAAKKAAIIETYKSTGKSKEIQTALVELKKEYESKILNIPNSLCWLYGKSFKDYLHDVEICQEFARKSREKMAQIILERTGMTAEESFHTIHNYIDTEEMILRKGAIAAHKGKKVLIPVNMRDGSILAIGKGNDEWNQSAPHGAGRLMSRSKARETVDMEEYKKSMSGIYTTSVNECTLDEAPMAYKSLEDIIDVVSESVDIMEVMKPVFNFKSS